MLNTSPKESLIKHGFTQEQCEIEMLVFLVAGTETTACAIRCILIHIITCPSAYFKLKQEVSEVVHNGTVSHPITLAEANQLPYLRVGYMNLVACIKAYIVLVSDLRGYSDEATLGGTLPQSRTKEWRYLEWLVYPREH
jgi:hypothetical protein